MVETEGAAKMHIKRQLVTLREWIREINLKLDITIVLLEKTRAGRPGLRF